MKSIGSYEAKTHLPMLLKQVAQGETFTITKHGLPVAMLVPVNKSIKPEASAVAQRIKQAPRWKLTKGISIKDLIEEGRR